MAGSINTGDEAKLSSTNVDDKASSTVTGMRIKNPEAIKTASDYTFPSNSDNLLMVNLKSIIRTRLKAKSTRISPV